MSGDFVPSSSTCGGTGTLQHLPIMALNAEGEVLVGWYKGPHMSLIHMGASKQKDDRYVIMLLRFKFIACYLFIGLLRLLQNVSM